MSSAEDNLESDNSSEFPNPEERSKKKVETFTF
jgi:hypothetical protein